MTFRINDVGASQYLRLRGTNMPPSVPFETDANGNPLTDLWTNASAAPVRQYGDTVWRTNTRTVSTCAFRARRSARPSSTDAPSHLGTRNGQKYSSYDVAAWSDLWFYSNPIFIEVIGLDADRGRQLGRDADETNAARQRAAFSHFQKRGIMATTIDSLNDPLTSTRRRRRVPRWLREPLLHFVVLGGVLFGADHLLFARTADPRVIVVDARGGPDT